MEQLTCSVRFHSRFLKEEGGISCVANSDLVVFFCDISFLKCSFEKKFFGHDPSLNHVL